MANPQLMDLAKLSFYLLVFLSLVLAIINFNYLKNWNKKQLTIQMLNDLQKNLKKHFIFLHKTFKYKDLDKALNIQDIHDSMGYFLEDCNKNSEDYNPSEIVDISGKKFIYDNNGEKINVQLQDFLNDLEAFSAAVNDKTYDDKQSKKLMRGVIAKAYKTFNPYIQHLINEHKEDKRIYCELRKLGKKWSNS